LQRYAYMAIGLISALAAMHGPGRIGTLLYAVFADLCAVGGLAFAGLQLTKTGLAESCLADPVGEFVNTLPSANWWPEYLFATGGCGAKFPPILGLSVPVWSLLGFAFFSLTCSALAVYALRKR
jgi:protein dithiol:quinone oxidoreductase